jgi:hypothetical protein
LLARRQAHHEQQQRQRGQQPEAQGQVVCLEGAVAAGPGGLLRQQQGGKPE